MHLTKVKLIILCLKAMFSKACLLCHQLEPASFSRLILGIPGGVVIALVQSIC